MNEYFDRVIQKGLLTKEKCNEKQKVWKWRRMKQMHRVKRYRIFESRFIKHSSSDSSFQIFYPDFRTSKFMSATEIGGKLSKLSCFDELGKCEYARTIGV